MDAARAQGLAAADIPQRTPVKVMEELRSSAMARSQLAELTRLADLPTVRLDRIMGGLRPWFNKIAETGAIGPMPLDAHSFGGLTPDEMRLLATARDYADSVLRIRSGAQISPQEFERMLTFLPTEQITPQTFRVRVRLQDDFLRARDQATRQMLEASGYRAPTIPVPSMTPPAWRWEEE